MDRSLEVVVLPVSDIDCAIESYRDKVGFDLDGGTFFGFSDPDGNTWAVHQLKVRGETPLIPPEHRGRFGEGKSL
jgi:hypothetical protein